jgi:hypothetical protein
VARVIGRPAEPGGGDLSLRIEDDQVRVRYTSADEQGRPRDLLDVAVTIYRPDADPVETTLTQTGPGSYEGVAPASGSGAYVGLARPRGGGAALTPAVAGATARVGLEFGSLSSNRGLLEQIAGATGGRSLAPDTIDAATLWDRTGIEPTRARTPIWRTLVLWTLAIFLLDVAGRRIAWDRFTSARYGGGWGAIAASVRDQSQRGGLAQRTLARAGEARQSAAEQLRSALGDRPALGEEEAARLRSETQQRRRERLMEEIRQRHAPPGASPNTVPAPSPPAPGERRPTPESAQEPESAPESGLLAAKRRAQKRFEQGDD